MNPIYEEIIVKFILILNREGLKKETYIVKSNVYNIHELGTEFYIVIKHLIEEYNRVHLLKFLKSKRIKFFVPKMNVMYRINEFILDIYYVHDVDKYYKLIKMDVVKDIELEKLYKFYKLKPPFGPSFLKNVYGPASVGGFKWSGFG